MDRSRRPLLLLLAVVLLAGLMMWLSRSPHPPTTDVQQARARGVPVQALAKVALISSRGRPLPSAALSPSPNRKPCVRGVVLNAVTFTPVGNASISLATQKGAQQFLTRSDGTFEAALDEPGTVDVAEVTAAQFFPFRPAWGQSPVSLTVQAGRCVDHLTLSLVPHVPYRGRVETEEGKPVANARITIGSSDEVPGAPLQSDVEGRFSFTAKDGDTLVVEHDSYESAVQFIDFRIAVSGTLVVVLRSKRVDAGALSFTLSGVVVDERDAGVPEANVMVQRIFERSTRLELELEADSSGAFTVPVSGRGPWQLMARTASGSSLPVTSRGERTVLRILEGTELNGRVRSATGHAVEAFSVTVKTREGPLALGSEESRHFVNAQGTFRLRGLVPGPVEVSVSAVGHASAEPVKLELVRGAPATAEFILREGGSLSGIVIDRTSKTALPRARISLEGTDEGTLAALPRAMTDDRGGFELSHVPPGRRSLLLAATGHHARLLSVSVVEGQALGPLTVDLAPLDTDEEPRLELVGVGAVLKARDELLVVEQVIPGGGAALAGLVPGDGILSIDGVAATTLGFGGAIERIRGEEGTTVSLEVRKIDGSTHTIQVTRRRIEK